MEPWIAGLWTSLEAACRNSNAEARNPNTETVSTAPVLPPAASDTRAVSSQEVATSLSSLTIASHTSVPSAAEPVVVAGATQLPPPPAEAIEDGLDSFSQFSKLVQSDPNNAKVAGVEKLTLHKLPPVPSVALHFLVDSVTSLTSTQALLNLPKNAHPLFEASFDSHLLSPPELAAERRVYMLDLSPTRVLSEAPDAQPQPQQLPWPAFDPGDAVALLFENDPQEVESLLERLGVPVDLRDRPLHLHLQVSGSDAARVHVPEHLTPFLEGAHAVTLRQLLLQCCDLRSAPPKQLLRYLLSLLEGSTSTSTSTSTAERERQQRQRELLTGLCSAEGSSLYRKHLVESHMTLLDVLSVFDSVQLRDVSSVASTDQNANTLPKLASFLWLLPRLARSRYYSIANSPLTSPQVIRVIYNVMDLEASRPYRLQSLTGLCTGFLERLIVASESDNSKAALVHVFFRPSPPVAAAPTASLPPAQPSKTPVLYRAPFRVTPASELQRPLVFVATGTGLAPFLGFLEHRCAQMRRALELDETRCGLLVGPVLVLFGCRTLSTESFWLDRLAIFGRWLENLTPTPSGEEEKNKAPVTVGSGRAPLLQWLVAQSRVKHYMHRHVQDLLEQVTFESGSLAPRLVGRSTGGSTLPECPALTQYLSPSNRQSSEHSTALASNDKPPACFQCASLGVEVLRAIRSDNAIVYVCGDLQRGLTTDLLSQLALLDAHRTTCSLGHPDAAQQTSAARAQSSAELSDCLRKSGQLREDLWL